MIAVVAAQLFVTMAFLLFIASQAGEDLACEAFKCLMLAVGVGLRLVLPILVISTVVSLGVLARWGGQSLDRLGPALGLATLFGCWVLAACGWFPVMMLIEDWY
ncbi:hypothetical protein AB0C02_01345 [Micromonospora sp. NPDC048999]|uniref:hypothetical protein n=1 Tax=Micromonospora sp. NPDC048999 TaxID=3155391 RepID=UPI0033F38760